MSEARKSQNSPFDRGIFKPVGGFRPDHVLGSEGAFLVQHAIDGHTGGQVALKRPMDRTNQRSLTSLSVEAAALSRLKHPGIPSLVRCALEGDDPYLAMEFIHGVRYNLNNIMDDRQAYVVRLTISACHVLSQAHKEGIIHRDICPANLVMSHDRNTLNIVDFGVAYVPGMPDLGADRLVGRADFASPEQTVPGLRLDGRADVYSLGVIAYMYLSGRSPFTTAAPDDRAMIAAKRSFEPIPLRQAAPHLHPLVSAVITSSISRDPMKRYQSADDFADALSHCLGSMEY